METEELKAEEKPIESGLAAAGGTKLAGVKNGKTYASSENEVEKLLSLGDESDEPNLVGYETANPYGRDYFDQYEVGTDELLNFDESEFEARGNPVGSPVDSEDFVKVEPVADGEKPAMTTSDYDDSADWLKEERSENDHESEDTILAFGNELDDFAAAVARKALRASTNPTVLPSSLNRSSPQRTSPEKSVPLGGLRCHHRDEYEDEDRIVERREPLTLIASSDRPLRAAQPTSFPPDSPSDEDFYPGHHDSHASEEVARLKAQLLERELEDDSFRPGAADLPTPPVLIRPRPPTPPKQKSHDASEEEDEDETEEVPLVLPTGFPRKSRGSISFQIGTKLVHPKHDFDDSPKWTWKDLDPNVLDLIYWKDVQKTGVVFTTLFAFLLCLATFSTITVFAYIGLAVLVVTISYRLFKQIMAKVQKTDETNPFQSFLDKNMDLQHDKLSDQVNNMITHIQGYLRSLRRLFLVENVIDSLKFAALLWALTYIGCWISGIGLLILAFLGTFTVPKLYEVYKVQIDQAYDTAYKHWKTASDQIEAKVPFLKKKKAE